MESEREERGAVWPAVNLPLGPSGRWFWNSGGRARGIRHVQVRAGKPSKCGLLVSWIRYCSYSGWRRESATRCRYRRMHSVLVWEPYWCSKWCESEDSGACINWCWQCSEVCLFTHSMSETRSCSPHVWSQHSGPQILQGNGVSVHVHFWISHPFFTGLTLILPLPIIVQMKIGRRKMRLIMRYCPRQLRNNDQITQLCDPSLSFQLRDPATLLLNSSA
jgi:hypothetical protein